MRRHVLFAALAASVFAGCSGGGGGSSPTPVGGGSGTSGSGSTTQAENVAAISDATAMGSPMRDFSLFDASVDPASAGVQAAVVKRAAAGSGTCNNGLEFYAPDKNGDANSTETIVFYDSACTDEARDTVRIYTSTGASSETVNINVSLFAPNNATPIATRSATHTITGASFNTYGYPIVADGFDLQSTDTLNIASARTIASSHEYVIGPSTSGSNGFCSDSAGYNATGVASTGKTFGWNGGVNGGTRMINGDGSVTWTATHAGTTYVGTIGGLSIVSGAPNTACPITTPMFTLGGGTATGTYSIPVVVTMLHGMIESISVTNATLNNGDTLNITTNSSQPPSSSLFITGTVTNGSTQVATFAVNAFGDGTLTSSKTGAQYVITDWRVIR